MSGPRRRSPRLTRAALQAARPCWWTAGETQFRPEQAPSPTAAAGAPPLPHRGNAGSARRPRPGPRREAPPPAPRLAGAARIWGQRRSHRPALSPARPRRSACPASPSPAQLGEACVIDAEVVRDLVDNRPADLLQHLGLGVADRADGPPVDRDPVRQDLGGLRGPAG